MQFQQEALHAADRQRGREAFQRDTLGALNVHLHEVDDAALLVQLMSLVQVGDRPRPREIGRFSVTLIREIH